MFDGLIEQMLTAVSFIILIVVVILMLRVVSIVFLQMKKQEEYVWAETATDRREIKNKYKLVAQEIALTVNVFGLISAGFVLYLFLS